MRYFYSYDLFVQLIKNRGSPWDTYLKQDKLSNQGQTSIVNMALICLKRPSYPELTSHKFLYLLVTLFEAQNLLNQPEPF